MVNPPPYESRDPSTEEWGMLHDYITAIWDELAPMVRYSILNQSREGGRHRISWGHGGREIGFSEIAPMSYGPEETKKQGYGLIVPSVKERYAKWLDDFFPSEGSAARAALVYPAKARATGAMEQETYRRQPA
jgi:hypothetical protein